MEEKDVIALLESFMKEHTEKMHAEFDGVYSQVPIHHPAAMMHFDVFEQTTPISISGYHMSIMMP